MKIKKKRGVLNRKAQLSLEYIIIFAFIMMIIIPTAYLLRNYIGVASDTITMSQIERVSRVLIDNAREMYYASSPAKVVITIDMPDQIEAMWIMDRKHNLSATQEYVLAYRITTFSGSEIRFHDSDIPIQCWNDAATPCGQYEENVDEINKLNPQCRVSIPDSNTGHIYGCYTFPERDISSGVKRFKLEAYDNCRYDDDTYFSCVRVDEVSNLI